MAETREIHTQQREQEGANGNAPHPQEAPPDSPPAGLSKEPGRPWLRPVLLAALAVVLVIGGVVGARYWSYASTHVGTDNAQLVSDVVQIAPQVSGTVRQALVRENQDVKAGDLLVVLEDSTYRAAVEQARANLDAAIAQAQGAGIGVALAQETGSAQQAQAQGVVEQAESGIAGAQADVARAEAAVATASANAASARAGIGNARAAVNAAVANRQRTADAAKAAEAQVETARAGVRAAQAAVDVAQTNLSRSERDAQRYAKLVAEGAVSEQAADTAAAAAQTARAQLDSARQQVAQAQASVAARQAEWNAAREQAEAARAAIAQAKAQQSASEEQATAARAGVRQTQAARNAAVQSVHAAEARRRQALGQLGQARTAPRQVAASRSAQAQAAAKIEQARAALKEAQIRLDDTRIVAPISGRVSKKGVEVGALVQPGTPLMALVPQNDVWVVANFKETQLADVRPGRPAEVEVDALPGRKFRGKVDSISAATGATFALLPPDNATGNFTKVVQRVPVKITLDPGQSGMDRLRAGLSVTATVETK